jgi:hypothetical protein
VAIFQTHLAHCDQPTRLCRPSPLLTYLPPLPQQSREDPIRISGKDPLVTSCFEFVACANVKAFTASARVRRRTGARLLEPHAPVLLSGFHREGFDSSLRQDSALIHSHSCTYKFTIDKRPDLWYHSACYLESTSLTPPATAPLTLAPSIACGLFVVAKKVNSFGIKQIQPLLPKHPGWGVPAHLTLLESATYSLFFPVPVAI